MENIDGDLRNNKRLREEEVFEGEIVLKALSYGFLY